MCINKINDNYWSHMLAIIVMLILNINCVQQQMYDLNAKGNTSRKNRPIPIILQDPESHDTYSFVNKYHERSVYNRIFDCSRCGLKCLCCCLYRSCKRLTALCCCYTIVMIFVLVYGGVSLPKYSNPLTWAKEGADIVGINLMALFGMELTPPSINLEFLSALGRTCSDLVPAQQRYCPELPMGTTYASFFTHFSPRCYTPRHLYITQDGCNRPCGKPFTICSETCDANNTVTCENQCSGGDLQATLPCSDAMLILSGSELKNAVVARQQIATICSLGGRLDPIWAINLMKKSVSDNDLPIMCELLQNQQAVIYPLRIQTYVDTIEQHRPNILKILKSSGIEPDSVDDDGNNAAMLASASGKLDALRDLDIQERVPLEVVNHQGNSALHLAAIGNHADIVQYLMQQGVPIDTQNKDGNTPLMEAARVGAQEAIRIILQYNPAFNLINKNGENLLHLSSCAGNAIVLENFIKDMLDKKLYATMINARDRKGNTPIMTSARYGHLTSWDILRQYAANPHLRNDQEQTALIIASIFKKPAMTIHILPVFRKYIDLVDFGGNTALYYAVQNNDLEGVGALLSIPYLADPMIDNVKHKNAYSQVKSQEMWDLMLSHGSQEGAVLYAAVRGDLPQVQYILQHPDKSYNIIHPFLMMNAIRSGGTKGMSVLLFLLDYGVNPNFEDVEGMTPLSLAAKLGELGMVDQLLRYRVNINYKDTKRGYTALMWAARTGKTATVRQLIKYVNLRTDAVNNQDSTALQLSTDPVIQEILSEREW